MSEPARGIGCVNGRAVAMEGAAEMEGMWKRCGRRWKEMERGVEGDGGGWKQMEGWWRCKGGAGAVESWR